MSRLSYFGLCGLLIITSTTALLSSASAPTTTTQGSLDTQTSSTLSAGPDGICYTYVVQGGDTCARVTQKYHLTAADINQYNANNWLWKGCDLIAQGDFICLSPGDPPMPVALAAAVCGPQVPGTVRPSTWSDLASLNPCPSKNDCCTIGGQCDSTDFWCGKSDRCISNCGIKTKTTKATTATTTKRASTTTDAVSTSTAAETTTHHTTTTTSAGPEWTLVAYEGSTCDKDYYVLKGSKSEDQKCVNIFGGTTSTISDQGVYCKKYSNGGFDSADCNIDDEASILSWTLHKGVCNVSDQKCGEGGHALNVQPQDTCNAKNPTQMRWQSLTCMVTA
ncbi:hypothetical protein N7462_000874 [Penicillium macrosclerotiorum]|uniref:uncharacterized protein n=1 Tax=Penicillium macrosclerotiorum TaxID=303699 RepID=UPI0025466A98|nr:uncharacterized protein N7462_000874 [Penicillium macrosclerotiorum]KAJ5698869.1 hypothetical protein N7462_000874 [Penicillium macrosclerotiorum]